MAEWMNLSHTIPVDGYAVNKINTIDSDGAGTAILLSIVSKKHDDVFHFLLNPELAHLIGWEVIGIERNYNVPSADLDGRLEEFDDSDIWSDLEDDE
jgi:hypothetical protein